MAITERGHFGANSGTTAVTSLNLTVPSGIAAGDVGYIVLAIANTARTLNALTGWTVVGGSPITATGLRCWLLRRTMDGTESGTTVTPTLNSTSVMAAGIVVFAGGLAANEVISTATLDSTEDAVSATSAVTPAVADALLITLFGVRNTSIAGTTGGTAPTGYTEVWDYDNGVTSGANGRHGVYVATKQLTGQSGVSQASVAGAWVPTSAREVNWTIALGPAAVPITGAGAAAAPAGVADGDGTVQLTGTGAAAAAAGTADGDGTVGLTGSAGATSPAGTAAGAGTLATQGAGAATAPAGTGDGDAAVRLTGAGAAAGSTGAADGDGTLASTGSGAAAASPGAADGDGLLGITGTGAAAAAAGEADGSGQVGSTVTGAGDADAPAGQAAGTGTVALAGAGTPSAPTGTAAGSAAVGLSGPGAGTGAGGEATGAGDVTLAGAGTAVAPEAIASGTGTVTDSPDLPDITILSLLEDVRSVAVTEHTRTVIGLLEAIRVVSVTEHTRTVTIEEAS